MNTPSNPFGWIKWARWHMQVECLAGRLPSGVLADAWAELDALEAAL